MRNNGISFQEVVVGQDIHSESVKAIFPGATSVPIVVINEQWVNPPSTLVDLPMLLLEG